MGDPGGDGLAEDGPVDIGAQAFAPYPPPGGSLDQGAALRRDAAQAGGPLGDRGTGDADQTRQDGDAADQFGGGLDRLQGGGVVHALNLARLISQVKP